MNQINDLYKTVMKQKEELSQLQSKYKRISVPGNEQSPKGIEYR